MEQKEEYRAEKSKMPQVVIGLLIVLILLGGGWILMKEGASSGFLNLSNKASESIKDTISYDKAKYQAVFLNNGQVYFGKIDSYNDSYLELTNIYYIQVIPALQQGQEDDKNDNKKQEQQQDQITLVKLGNELHGPMDKMTINKDQVVFVEDMKDDSKVVQAINQYVNKQ